MENYYSSEKNYYNKSSVIYRLIFTSVYIRIHPACLADTTVIINLSLNPFHEVTRALFRHERIQISNGMHSRNDATLSFR